MSKAEKNPLVLAVDLEFHGRYVFENEDQAAKRRVARNEAAAVELRRLAAVEQELEALKRALQTIADWNTHSLELAVEKGSNGVREFYRQIAVDTLYTLKGIK